MAESGKDTESILDLDAVPSPKRTKVNESSGGGRKYSGAALYQKILVNGEISAPIYMSHSWTCQSHSFSSQLSLLLMLRG